jgi:hypothetical protein
MLPIFIWLVCFTIVFSILLVYVCMAEVKPPKMPEEMRMRLREWGEAE